MSFLSELQTVLKGLSMMSAAERRAGGVKNMDRGIALSRLLSLFGIEPHEKLPDASESDRMVQAARSGQPYRPPRTGRELSPEELHRLFENT
jgi:hypothetical protein